MHDTHTHTLVIFILKWDIYILLVLSKHFWLLSRFSWHLVRNERQISLGKISSDKSGYIDRIWLLIRRRRSHRESSYKGENGSDLHISIIIIITAVHFVHPPKLPSCIFFLKVRCLWFIYRDGGWGEARERMWEFSIGTVSCFHYFSLWFSLMSTAQKEPQDKGVCRIMLVHMNENENSYL